MNVTIKINCDNAAFEHKTGSEIARILRTLAGELQFGSLVAGVSDRSLRDVNGNTVGEFKVEGKGGMSHD